MRIELDRVTKSYGGRAVVEAVSLDVAAGELVAVLGPSGSGKSTLLAMVAGLVAPTEGAIRLDGTVASDPAVRMPPRERRVGMVFQEPLLWPHMTVEQHLKFVAPEADGRELLEALELAPRAKARPATLSGGEAQRLAIARALVVRPRALLLDEPLGALDRRLKAQLLGTIVALHRRYGTTTLYVTHDYEEALRVADRVAIMTAGRLAQVGTPEAVYRTPASEEVARLTGPVSAWTEPPGWVRPEQLDVRADAGGAGEVRAARCLGDRWEIDVALDGRVVTAYAAGPLAGRVRVERVR